MTIFKLMNFYIIAWISQAFMKYFKLQYDHIDDEYNQNMFDPSDTLFMKHLLKK